MTELVFVGDIHNRLDRLEAVVEDMNRGNATALISIGDDFDKEVGGRYRYDHIRRVHQEKLESLDISEETEQKIQEFVQQARENNDLPAEEVQQGINKLIEENENIEELQQARQKGKENLFKYLVEEGKGINDVYAKCTKPVYGIFGNHDPILRMPASLNMERSAS